MMSTTAKRLQVLDNQVVSGQFATQKAALVKSGIIKDGDKSYPEIVDYHPEK